VTTTLSRIRCMTASVCSLVSVLFAASGCSSAGPNAQTTPQHPAPSQDRHRAGAGCRLPADDRCSHDAPKSESVPITLTLTSPDGKHVQFYTTSVFAYAGKESTEDLFTTPAQWFAATGRFTITAPARRYRPPLGWPSMSSVRRR